MKAACRTRYGPPDVLRIEELPRPEPRDDEVLIRVHATTVNRTDCAALSGTPFVYRFFLGLPRPKRRATGTDFAGEVAAVGSSVTTFKVGDRVWGFDDNGTGSHAQYMTIAADKGIAHIPDGISYEVAAASAEGAHYALNFMNKVKLEPGQRVLVNGATGAIGSAAVQLLKNQGLHVTAVCGPEQVETVASLGADRVIDRFRVDFTQEDMQYDLVFDAVGKSRFGLCKQRLTRRGVYISSELGPRGENILLALTTPLLGGKRVAFPLPVDIRTSLATLKKLLEEGRFRPLIDRRYPLEQIREAFHYVASGQKIGNVILSLD